MQFPTRVSKFGKNKDNLRFHNFVSASTDLFVIGFLKLRPFLISTYKYVHCTIFDSMIRLVNLKIAIL